MRGPLGGCKWPEPVGPLPGAWLQAEGPLALCRTGAHVCRPSDLPYWLHDELWETEVDGDQIEGIDCLVVRRARLRRRIDGWHQGGATRFAEACAHHAAELANRAPGGASATVRGYLDDAEVSARYGYPAVSAHAAALAVARLGYPVDDPAAYRREREWQADWIVRSLIER
jgi:hypothetical protein